MQAGVFSNLYTNQYGCDSLVIETVTAVNIDTVTSQQTICQGEEVAIFGQMTGTSGLYCQTYNSVFGCDSTICIELLVLPSNIQTSIDVEHIKCAGVTTGSASISVAGNMNDYQFEWNTGSTTTTISNLSAGWYFVTVTDNSGCYNSSSPFGKKLNIYSILILKSIATCL